MNLFKLDLKLQKTVRVLVYPNITFQEDLEKDSYIQVVNGLQMFNKKAIKKFINSKSKEIKKEILDDSKTHYKEVLSAKKNIEYVSHKDLLEEIRNSTKEGT